MTAIRRDSVVMVIVTWSFEPAPACTERCAPLLEGGVDPKAQTALPHLCRAA